MMNTKRKNSTIDSNTSKKRKKLSREELHEQDVGIRYSKLVNTGAKFLRKEAKVCKAFECQKIIRKIKAIKASSSNHNDDFADKTEGDDETTKSYKMNKKIQNLEEKLNLTKAFELDELVYIALTRLGLDPTKVTTKKAKNENNAKKLEKEDTDSMDASTKEKHNQLIESILTHKKMIAAIEVVNKSATEYNIWLARKEERLSGKETQSKKTKKKNKNHNNNSSSKKSKSSDVSDHIADSGLFIDSLAGKVENDDADDDILAKYAGFGQEEGNDVDENDDEFEIYTDAEPRKKRKNRMGQRERKARAMALEAKQQHGKPFDPRSIKKWYELKPKNPKKEKKNNTSDNKSQLASGLDATKKVDASEVVNMGSNWKDEGKAHPSWAARQVQKSKSGSGIGNIEFKGKKITFD